MRSACLSLCLGLPLVAFGGEPGLAIETDPANALISFALKENEVNLYRGLFQALGSDDFETRESALSRLIARGPAVFPLAEEYAKSQDVEVSAQAKSLHQKILFQYDGYLPVSPALQAALKSPVELGSEEKETVKAAIDRIANAEKIPLVYDPRIPLPSEFQPHGIPKGSKQSAGEALAVLAAQLQLSTILRGNAMVLTSVGEVQRLERQRHSFDWKALGLDRAEAARVGEGLKAFIPEGLAELHTGSEVLSIRGSSAAIQRAARLIALLKPGAPAQRWPAPGKTDLPVAEVTAALAKPVKVALNQDEFLLILDDFKKQGLSVRVVSGGKAYSEPPFSVDFTGLAPVSLNIRDVPLGLALRWLVKRTGILGAQANEHALYAEVSEDGHIQFRVGTKVREILQLAVAGVEVHFLWPPDASKDGGEQADLAAQKRLAAALRGPMEIYPDFEMESDLRVLRGRALIQGSPAALTRALELISQWKESGQPPVCERLHTLMHSLDQPREWDGRGLGAGKLLGQLKQLGAAPILLEDSADGEAPNFKLSPAQAELLPPGKHTVRELLDDLVSKAGARWEVRWGAVVISPLAKRPK